ncbi:aspartate aminotransferase family protein [Bifidobacterium subtile]|jgi:acetylornithine/N-succinyldiaminopimelate aminotransferase|uniref:Acetylornithine aminotransferase apoenzyme n=1 Tax=Bifidobacterium subtile TaxID=77635 RepID=A0A087E564_9BIFI|nr:aspartate aminotransferase family protein [Bifidobacterium subtile]KFJ02915.1 Acetylornithine aminotransferase apoenzyme [Bifidobacterium subtile]MCI1223521.1 aspartate aminotransferase family protein [Bifidobacterium subtile]MCI1242007.1 aspartate aminotransferase family protein [Bifidobacterium subtile]MCI1258712.1 aspartate aminotransferase family protein [Bifidobacterium subtile]QOL36525.1 aspartate aminotransferase family protein [Bifidobacterium subtile]
MKLSDTGLSEQELKDMAKTYMIETYERYDFVAERAEGMYLYDPQGNAYLDFYGGIAVNNAGNCNPKVVAALREQVGDIMHTFNYPYTIPQVLLAKQVCEASGFDKIFFQNSGTEANEVAIKLARKYGIDHFGKHKFEILSALNSFHGRTFGSLAATGQPGSLAQDGFGQMTPGFTYAKFNDLEDFKANVTENTIAIMIEPVQGEGGVNPATPEFIEGLRALCDEKDILLIFDEVQTGWGRTGSIFAWQGYGVKPDILTMAKGLGGGVPIGAMVTTDAIAAALTPGTHGSTFGGSPMCTAAALAETSEIIERNLPANAKTLGEYMIERGRELPHIKESRGRGLLVGFEFDSTVNAVDIKHAALKRGLLTTAIGDSIIRCIPPLIVTKQQVDEAIGILVDAVNAVAAGEE